MLKFPTMSPDMGWRLRVLGGFCCCRSFFREEGWLFLPVLVLGDELPDGFMPDLNRFRVKGELSSGTLGLSR